MKAKFLLTSGLLLAFSIGLIAQSNGPKNMSQPVPPLPLDFPSDSVRYLRDLVDSDLQLKLQQEVFKNQVETIGWQ